jgi:predicted DCC family thiol-disulfide oxidoreductase YuxK
MSDRQSQGPILLYDGDCGLCDATVQWVLSHDTARVFRMAQLGGATASEVMARHPELPATLDSLIVVEILQGREVVHWESRAVSAGARHLNWPWRALSWVRLCPRFLADPVYRFVARHRLKWMGRRDSCRMPSVADKDRFLA